MAEALKVNATLKSLKCAAPLTCPIWKVSAAADTLLTLCALPICSVTMNDIGPTGAKYFAEALEVNTTLKELRCATRPPLPNLACVSSR